MVHAFSTQLRFPPPPAGLAADIADADLISLFQGADAVVHLAWLIQPSPDQATLWRANVEGSERVFHAVAAAGVPTLAYAPSVGAYSPEQSPELDRVYVAALGSRDANLPEGGGSLDEGPLRRRRSPDRRLRHGSR